MEMTKTEIIGKYRRMQTGRSRKQTIETLAQLNGCERYEIAKILDDNGLELPETLEYYKKQMEKDMCRRVEEAAGARKMAKDVPGIDVGNIKVEKIAPTRCQPGKSVGVWEQETHENTQKVTENEKNSEKMTDDQVNLSTVSGKERRGMPQSVAAALMDRIEILEEEMQCISKEQKRLAEQLKKKETEFLEICGFMGLGPKKAGS